MFKKIRSWSEEYLLPGHFINTEHIDLQNNPFTETQTHENNCVKIYVEH